MPRRKNTIKTDEVGCFFKKSTKEAMKVIYEVITATKTTDCGLGLASACNAVQKTDFLSHSISMAKPPYVSFNCSASSGESTVFQHSKLSSKMLESLLSG